MISARVLGVGLAESAPLTGARGQMPASRSIARWGALFISFLPVLILRARTMLTSSDGGARSRRGGQTPDGWTCRTLAAFACCGSLRDREHSAMFRRSRVPNETEPV